MSTISSTLKRAHQHSENNRLLQNGLTPRGRRNQKADSIVFVYFLPTLAAIVCYLNGLGGDYVHDDIYAIKDNPDATGKAPIERVFHNDFWGKPMCDNTSHKSYRPLTVLSFRLDYYIGGGSPWHLHAVNVILHAAVTCLFVHVLRAVVHVKDPVACLAALLFALHPVHTEAVTGIVGRAELLSCLGVLLSLLCYARCLGIHHRQQAAPCNAVDTAMTPGQMTYFCLSMALAGAAMLCKEHGITVLGICVILDVFVFSRTVTRRWLRTRAVNPDLRALLRRLAVLASVTAGLLWFRVWMMCGQLPTFKVEDNPASFSPTWLTRVLSLNYLVARNAWLLLCPVTLSYDWQGGSIPLVTTLSDVRNLATVTVYVITGWAAYTCLRSFLKNDKKKKMKEDPNNNPIIAITPQHIGASSSHPDPSNTSPSPSGVPHKVTTTVTTSTSSSPAPASAASSDGHRVLLVSMVMMALPFLPSSNLFFRVGFVLAERVLYVPSLGYCLLVAEGAVRLWDRHKNRGRGYVAWGLALSATALLAAFALKAYTRNSEWRSRETLFLSGLQTLPHNAKMHYNYGNFLKDSGRGQQAAQHYRTAISLNPDQPSHYNNLGTVVGDREEAERCYRKALSLHPTHRGALVNLGNLLIKRNDSSTGEQLLQRALALDPRYVDALVSLGQLELWRGGWAQAEQFIQRALRERPNMPDLHYFYGVFFHQTGHYEEAVVSYQRAVSLDHTHTPALINAAASLRQLGRDREAETLLKRAVASSQDVAAMGQLGRLYQRAGRTQDAVNIFSQLADRAPNDTHVLLGFVRTLMERGQFRQAEGVLTTSLTRSPHNAELLFAMGHVHMGLGHKTDAISAFTEALRWSGDNVELLAKAQYELGNIHKDLKQFSQALEYYQSAVTTNPAMTIAHHNLGALYHLTEEYDKARRHYEHVLRAEPDNQMLLQNLAKLDRAAARQRKNKIG